MMNRVPPQAQTYGFPTAAGLSLPGQQQHQQQPGRAMALPQPSPNKGTLVPGQVLRVGKIQVTVERYLSEGGFAHVYLVNTIEPLQGSRTHVLKRVAVRDRKLLDEVRREVEVMKLLRGHPNIVHLHDADAFHLPDGTHEVLILMEFCAGGGIIDLLNSRLQSRLSEQEILQIFVDVCEGVAKMHSLRPKPLVHRDLKVENILQAGERTFKLCDFGSAAYPRPPPQTLAEIKEVELDINTHTTMQYRSPEMVDVYQRRPIDEKADIWALGVFLYKLCYYTTPFEEHGPLAILNVQYRVPPYPVYSNQLNLLVGSMLQEHGSQRPSAVQLLKTVHSMRGTHSVNHYDEPVSSQTRGAGNDLFDIISSVGSPSPKPSPVTANITPMRRGRPTKLPTGAMSPQVSVPVANPAPPPNKGPTPAELTPQYTIPSTPLEPPISSQSQRPEITSRYTIPATPLEAPAAASKLSQPTINVTGEKSPVSTGAQTKPYAAGSWSSFGSASGSTSRPSPAPSAAFDGFADLEERTSLKAAQTSSSQTSGYSAFLPASAQNSLGPPPPSLPPRKPSSTSISAAPAFDGFADSFTDSFVPLSSSPQPMATSPLSLRPPSSASATVPLLAPPSSSELDAPLVAPPGPTREPSFDERYPSVEQLNLRSGPTSPQVSATEPPAPRGDAVEGRGFMPHAGRSYTGSAGQSTPSILDREPIFPLPRSTQITGMAMRDGEEGKPQRSAPIRVGGDGANGSWSEQSAATARARPNAEKRDRAPPKQLQDWLTGDASPAQESPATQPTLIPLTTAPSVAAGGPSAAPPVAAKPPVVDGVGRVGLNGEGLKGPRSPPAKAIKPTALKTMMTAPSTSSSSSSILSEQWSPIEAARAKLSTTAVQPASAPTRPGGQSSIPRSWSKTEVAPATSAAVEPQSPPKMSSSSPSTQAAFGSATSSSSSSSATLAASNRPRRLPTIDSDSAATFLRGKGPSSLGRSSSTASSGISSSKRSRPLSLAPPSSAAVAGGDDEGVHGDRSIPPRTLEGEGGTKPPADGGGLTHRPPSSAPSEQPLVVRPVIVAPKPQRPQTPSSSSSSSFPSVAAGPNGVSSSTATGTTGGGRASTTTTTTTTAAGAGTGGVKVSRRDLTGDPIDPPQPQPSPATLTTPTAAGGGGGGGGAGTAGNDGSSSSPPAVVEERKSVKSLIDRWNQAH